jgi:hypothetical protein
MPAITNGEREEELRHFGAYADAIGRAIVRWDRDEWNRGVPEVHVALYSHAFGTDVATFTSDREAREHLLDVALTQGARDRRARSAVRTLLGRWPASEVSAAERDAVIERWGDLVRGEALWISRCALEREFSRRAFHAELDRVEGVHATPSDGRRTP